jgi:hypothetical protein
MRKIISLIFIFFFVATIFTSCQTKIVKEEGPLEVGAEQVTPVTTVSSNLEQVAADEVEIGEMI